MKSLAQYINENKVRSSFIGTDYSNRLIIVHLIKDGEELYFNKEKLFKLIYSKGIGVNYMEKKWAEQVFREFKDADEIEISKDDGSEEWIVGRWVKKEIGRGFQEE